MFELNDEPVRSARASNRPLSAPLGPALRSQHIHVATDSRTAQFRWCRSDWIRGRNHMTCVRTLKPMRQGDMLEAWRCVFVDADLIGLVEDRWVCDLCSNAVKRTLRAQGAEFLASP